MALRLKFGRKLVNFQQGFENNIQCTETTSIAQPKSKQPDKRAPGPDHQGRILCPSSHDGDDLRTRHRPGSVASSHYRGCIHRKRLQRHPERESRSRSLARGLEKRLGGTLLSPTSYSHSLRRMTDTTAMESSWEDTRMEHEGSNHDPQSFTTLPDLPVPWVASRGRRDAAKSTSPRSNLGMTPKLRL